MPRERLRPGEWGEITTSRVSADPVRHRARARFRGEDGRKRVIERHCRTRRAAVEALTDALEELARLGGGSGTIVLLMAVANMRAIASALVDAGRPSTTPAVVIENASLPPQRIVRASLADLADVAEAAQIVPPAVVVIGDVASDHDAREALS